MIALTWSCSTPLRCSLKESNKTYRSSSYVLFARFLLVRTLVFKPISGSTRQTNKRFAWSHFFPGYQDYEISCSPMFYPPSLIAICLSYILTDLNSKHYQQPRCVSTWALYPGGLVHNIKKDSEFKRILPLLTHLPMTKNKLSSELKPISIGTLSK